MSWRDQLRKAKLGSAPFFVETTGAQIGRNTQVHEYPLRDRPYVEDLGRKARRFAINAYVIGADYMAARDALIGEIEAGGSKTLVHPYLGEMKVTVVECDGPNESTREGGMARFAITVIESGDRTFPSATEDTQLTVAEKAEAATEASIDAFTPDFSAIHMPSFVSTSAVDKIRGFADTLRSITRTVTTIPSKVTDFIGALSDLSGAASNLILAPHTLATRVHAIFEQLGEIVAAPVSAIDITRQLFRFGDDDPPVPNPTTPARVQQASNQAAFNGLIQRAAAMTAARVSATLPVGDAAQADITTQITVQRPVRFRSLEDVIGLRDELVAVLDAQAEIASTDALYYAVVDVRTAMVEDLQTRGAQLARIVRVNLLESWPAIVLSYEQYEDTAQSADIVARNAIRDPNFLPSGRDLEVLSDA